MRKDDFLRRADEAEALAQRLLDFAAQLRTEPTSERPLEWPELQIDFSQTIEALLKLRQLRSEHVDGRVFGEPAWELLLNLYRAHLDGTTTTPASLLNTTGTYPSTMRRWLRALVDLGLATCDEAEHGSASLTQDGVLRMTHALIAMQTVADFGKNSSIAMHPE